MGAVAEAEAARAAAVSDVAKHLGFRGRHLPLLYWVARNENRRTHGRLADLTTVRFGVVAAAWMLCRVAQDVQACADNLALTNLGGIYPHFRDTYAQKWVLRWAPHERPSPAAVAEELGRMLGGGGSSFPSPGWAINFSWGRASLTNWEQVPRWGDPTAEQRATLHRIRDKVAETQAAVGSQFLAHLRAHDTWEGVFGAKWVPLVTL